MKYKELIAKQTLFFNSNKTKEIVFRIDQLKKLKAVIKSHESDIYKAIYSDFKKSEFDTYTTELMILYAEIDETIDKISKWAKREKVRSNLAILPCKSYILPEPLGVCLIIGAWNYPFQLSLGPVIAAIAAGNTIVLKPSEMASASSAVIEKMIRENFSTDYITVVEGGTEDTTALLSEKFDKIFFTGSVAVGKIVYAAAAKHLTPITLELGGKSPAIVTKNCDLKITAKRLVWAKFLNAGQTCIAPDYILVDNTVKSELLGYLKEFIQQFNYSFTNNNYVQIINEKNFHRLISLIEKEKIYFGGESNLEERFIAPTLMTGVSFDDKIMEDEIFGPILPIICYDKLDEAIFKIKALPKALSCYVFSNDKAEKEKLLNEISFGGGAINDALLHISNSHLPFGGVGNSGIGSYHGKAGFSTFSHFKSIIEKPFWLDNTLRYSPNTNTKLSWIKRLIGK